MRGRTEHRGRIMRVRYSKEAGTFVAEEEIHPFLLRHLPTELQLDDPVKAPCAPTPRLAQQKDPRK